MATLEFELVEPPADPGHRELWLQHAAGFILFEDARGYALARIDPALPDEARAAARKAIDDALYGLMMVIDGVSGRLLNENHVVSLDFMVRLAHRDESETVVAEADLRHGDGMCIGYHGWLEGDFGDEPIAIPRRRTSGRSIGRVQDGG